MLQLERVVVGWNQAAKVAKTFEKTLCILGFFGAFWIWCRRVWDPIFLKFWAAWAQKLEVSKETHRPGVFRIYL